MTPPAWDCTEVLFTWRALLERTRLIWQAPDAGGRGAQRPYRRPGRGGI